MIEKLCFDLDNTLYPPGCGLLNKVDNNIVNYLKKYFKISDKEIVEKRKYYHLRYGSTLNGLCREENIEPIHYLEYIHKVKDSDLPKRDIKLYNMLKRIRTSKIIITNSYYIYAIRVLNALGILDLFDEIYDTVYMDFLYKNSTQALKKIIDLYGENGSKMVLIDDDKYSLQSAQQIGMIPIYVNNYNEVEHHFIYKINCIYELEEILRTIKE